MSQFGSNIAEFEMDISNWVKDALPKQVVAFHQKVAMEALEGVVNMNPVKTGRSRANWQAGLAPNDIEMANWPSRDPLTEGLQGISSVKPFGTIYLWNNVPYIVDLEDGSSRQAPNGMVAVTLARLEMMFE